MPNKRVTTMSNIFIDTYIRFTKVKRHHFVEAVITKFIISDCLKMNIRITIKF